MTGLLSTLDVDRDVQDELERKVWRLEADVRRLKSDLRDAREIAEEQSDNPALWEASETPREELLRKELARLHMVLKVHSG